MGQQAATIPQELFDVFTDNELPLPPLPAVALRFLQPVSTYAFSTHPEWTPVVGRRVVFEPSVDAALVDAAVPASEVVRFYCGIDGYGVQNWTFRYVLESPRLKLGIVLPYGSAFGNAAAELERIEQSYALIQGCLAATRCGEIFGTVAHGQLRMTLDADGLNFVLSDANSVVIQKGTRLAVFLDLLTLWGENAKGAGVQDWTRV